MSQQPDPSVSLTAVLGWSLVAMLLAAVGTSALLIVADRYDRPAVELTRTGRPTIVVQVAGAIATPGVYSLPAGARLSDAIAAGGGLRRDADPFGLNLAARVGDGESIVIDSAAAATPAAAPRDDAGGLVNINTATVEQLETLPGVGPAIGGRIVDYREEHGPFASVEALTEVEGISDNLLDELRPLVTVDD